MNVNSSNQTLFDLGTNLQQMALRGHDIDPPLLGTLQWRIDSFIADQIWAGNQVTEERKE